jgi:hypothetical protein
MQGKLSQGTQISNIPRGGMPPPPCLYKYFLCSLEKICSLDGIMKLISNEIWLLIDTFELKICKK